MPRPSYPDPRQSALFTYPGQDEESCPAPPGGDQAPPQPSKTRLAKCSDEVMRYTGLGKEEAEFFVVATVSLLLVGCSMILGGRKIRCSLAWFFTNYTSSTLAALDLAAKLVNLAVSGTEARGVVSHTGASVEAIVVDRLVLPHTISVGTSGPFRGLPRKGGTVDSWASTMRGQNPRGVCLTQLWAGSAIEVVRAMATGGSVGFGAMVGCLPSDEGSNIPAAMPSDIGAFDIGKLVIAVANVLAGGRMEFAFTTAACGDVIDAAKGHLHWADSTRQIAGMAVALHLLSGDTGKEVGAVAVSQAVALYHQSEAEKAGLMALGNKGDGDTDAMVDDLVMKVGNILAYALRTGCDEMSPRDVVQHGLAPNVDGAKLMLAVLEVRGEATQEMYIQNNRPLQKWRLHGLRFPLMDDVENKRKMDFRHMGVR